VVPGPTRQTRHRREASNPTDAQANASANQRCISAFDGTSERMVQVMTCIRRPQQRAWLGWTVKLG
jgi:hypothetical protein